ncbi:hypothetical protein P8452_54827 [Trifolium repens]|nr:hypothetical protein P8452_54827 [Trifolium repens]
MDSPPYLYYHHYDPTIINTHTLLQPQAYQQPTYFNTPPSQLSPYISPPPTPYINNHTSPPHSYSNFIVNNSSHYLPHHIDSIIQQLHHSQKACIQAISSLAADISTFNKYHTPSSTYHNTTTSPSLIWNSQNLPHHPQPINKSPCHSHYSIHHPNPFSIPTEMSETTTVTNKDPITESELISTIVHEHEFALTTQLVELKINERDEPHEIVVNDSDGDCTFLAVDSVLQVDKEETTKSSPILKIVVAIETAGETVFSISETDDATTQKDQVSLPPNPFSDPHDPLLCDSEGVASVTITSFGDVLKSLVPAKHRSFITTRSSLPPYRLAVMTRNDGSTLFGETKQQLLNHEFSVNNFERSFDFPIVCTFNFDPGGDKSSAAVKYGGNCWIFSLLLPWDRGKFGVCSFLPPASNLSHNCNTLSLLWKPLDRGKMNRKLMETILVPATSSCLFSEIWYFGNLVFANITLVLQGRGGNKSKWGIEVSKIL